MATIILQDVGVVSPRPLFRNLSLTIGPGDRIGLIAANGGGKSTLLRCIAGLAETGAGAVTLSRGLRLGLVEQDVPAALLDLTLAEAVRRALPPDRREHEGWRVGAVLDEFATPEALYDRPVRALSGGWQRLMLLARVWVTEPDALLLDEPTNHLDLEKIALLEAWIAGPAARTPLLVASHDRSFLDTSTTRTLFLRPGVSRMYAHPYSRARLLLADDDAAQDRKHTKDAKEAGRLRRNAGELRNIGVNSGSDLLQKKSMQLKERAEKLEQALRPAHVERTADIRLASRGTHAKSLVAIQGLVVRAPDGAPLFRVDKLDVRQGDRLVLLGRNGVGKSSLVRLLLRATREEVPGVRIAPSVVPGYADQQMSHLPAAVTPHQLIATRADTGDAQATRLLAGAGSASTHSRVRSACFRRVRRHGWDCWRCGWRRRTSICWTNRPTMSTSPVRSSWRRSCWIRGRRASWCRTTAASSGPSGRGSCRLSAGWRGRRGARGDSPLTAHLQPGHWEVLDGAAPW